MKSKVLPISNKRFLGHNLIKAFGVILLSFLILVNTAGASTYSIDDNIQPDTVLEGYYISIIILMMTSLLIRKLLLLKLVGRNFMVHLRIPIMELLAIFMVRSIQTQIELGLHHTNKQYSHRME